MKDNSTIEKNSTDKASNDTNISDNDDENNDLFNINNIILFVIVLMCGFFIAVVMSKFFTKE